MLSARKVVAVSESLADEIMLQYGKDAAAKLKVIHNPIDTDFWTPLAPLIRKGVREQLGFPDDSKVITFVALGDFERKGLPVLLEAISILRGRQQDYRVLAVGPTAESIMSLVHKSGLDPAVVLAVGPQRDVRPYYAAADAFCLPSMYESASLVMLEARASGLPLVVAQVGYAKGLTESGGGILIDRTAASVAQGLHQVLASQSSSPYKLPTRYEIQHFYAAWEALVTENCVARIEPFR